MSATHIPVWRRAATAGFLRPRLLLAVTGWWAVFFTSPIVLGLLLAEGFTALTDSQVGLAQLIAGLVLAIEGVRVLVLSRAAQGFFRWYVLTQSLLRLNLLGAQVASGGDRAGELSADPGEAVTRFRDDVRDIADFVDSWIDVVASLVFTLLAAVIMVSISPGGTAVLAVPLLAIGAVTRLLDTRIENARRADREATGRVTGLLADAMSSAVTLEVNGRRDPVVNRLEELLARRRRTAIVDRVLEDGLRSFGNATSDIGIGLVLLVVADQVASGEFAAAELILFTTYAAQLGTFPRMLGIAFARRNHARVALARMSELVAEADDRHVVEHRELTIDEPAPARGPAEFGARMPLSRLEVRELSVTLDDRLVVAPISFTLDRGTVTVITGEIGAGKSTLLRALLGLVPERSVSGEVRWNDEPLTDRAAVLIPPQAAYLPQVPALLSDTLADNILLGRGRPDDLTRAVDLAALGPDLATMAAGVDTEIGARGVRLSGGQLQRVAAARALVHGPELLLVDDLSSALDVSTELELWNNMASTGATVLAVSNRPAVLARADQVIELGPPGAAPATVVRHSSRRRPR